MINIIKLGIIGTVVTTIISCILGFMVKMWPVQSLQLITKTHFFCNTAVNATYTATSISCILLDIAVHALFGFFFFLVVGFIYNKLQ